MRPTIIRRNGMNIDVRVEARGCGITVDHTINNIRVVNTGNWERVSNEGDRQIKAVCLQLFKGDASVGRAVVAEVNRQLRQV